MLGMSIFIGAKMNKMKRWKNFKEHLKEMLGMDFCKKQ
jgi:hypothetical protein